MNSFRQRFFRDELEQIIPFCNRSRDYKLESSTGWERHGLKEIDVLQECNPTKWFESKKIRWNEEHLLGANRLTFFRVIFISTHRRIFSMLSMSPTALPPVRYDGTAEKCCRASKWIYFWHGCEENFEPKMFIDTLLLQSLCFCFRFCSATSFRNNRKFSMKTFAVIISLDFRTKRRQRQNRRDENLFVYAKHLIFYAKKSIARVKPKRSQQTFATIN